MTTKKTTVMTAFGELEVGSYTVMVDGEELTRQVWDAGIVVFRDSKGRRHHPTDAAIVYPDRVKSFWVRNRLAETVKYGDIVTRKQIDKAADFLGIKAMTLYRSLKF